MEDSNFILTDCQSILSQIKDQDKQLQLKRRICREISRMLEFIVTVYLIHVTKSVERWLMGLPTSKSKRKQLRGPEFLKEYRSLPETMLRDDDIFYETLKTRVEESFGGCTAEREYNVVQNSSQLFDTRKIKRRLLSCLDALTNKGLFQVATILTAGSIKFEKTKQQLKKIIRESLLKDTKNQNHHWQKNVFKHLSLILDDQRNFRENCGKFLTATFQSHGAAASMVLDGLEDLPFQALIAIHRKLRGVQGVIPNLRCHRYGKSRAHIIDKVRKISKEMLSELGEGDELQEPLAKAMAVAGLSLKLKPGCQNSSDLGFYQFSPEIKSLQNEIVKAIWLLKTKVRFQELKTVQNLLDPNSDVSNGSLRTATKKMFIEYLFECSDMDTIPKSLLESLATINRSSRTAPYKCFPKEEIEGEVECVLSVSAQTKQIVWDLLPDHEFDQDFADAYMEELEESDDGDDCDSDNGGGSSDGDIDNDVEIKNSQSCWFSSLESDDLAEGFGDSVADNSGLPIFATSGNGSCAHLTPYRRVSSDSVKKLKREHLARVDSDLHGSISTPQILESKFHSGTNKMNINHYQVESKDNVCLSRAGANSFSSFATPKERLNSNSFGKHEAELNTTRDTRKSRDFFSSNILFEDTKFIPNKQRTRGNQYVTIQEVCDETSVVAYNLIGYMLEKFAQEEEVDLDRSGSSYLRSNSLIQEYTQVSGEKPTLSQQDVGTSVIVKMVEELLPSLPESGIEKLKKLMDA
ncbi:hypothetical protein Ddye_023692 [Dipteronia dyeriana]|uniref:Uncharacterized protein n=1 Tax=Dipteronia dyeriana TaxID=168575 RepID=A0AAD9TUE7_9ROSI|nr:hypothetical protein Ddye_023692 [Dipteronia dyeriana]